MAYNCKLDCSIKIKNP